MVRRFFRDSAIYIIPSALSSGMSFFMFPFYAHLFTPRQYGEFDLLTLTGMLVGWTVALEIYQGVGRYVAGEKNRSVARSFASTALWFATAAYLAFTVIVEVFAVPFSHVLLGDRVGVSLLRVAAVWMAVQGVLAVAQAQLRWQLRPGAFAVASVISAVFTISSSAVLVFAAGLGVKGAVLGQLIGTAAGLVYVMAVTRGTFGLHFHLERCKQMLAFSVPLVPASIAVFLNLYADRLVIQHLLSLYDVGLYGIGYRIAMIVSLLVTGFQGAAMPLILTRKDDPGTPRDLARVFRIFSALALAIFVVLSLLATPALALLAAPEYQGAASIVPFLVMATLFGGINMFAPGMAIAKKTVLTAKLMLVAGVGNLVLALALVPLIGIMGAAIATAFTSVAWFALLMIASQRYYPVPHRWGQLITALVAVTAFVAISLAILPAGRAHALDVGLLAARIALIVAGLALSARLSLGGEELRGASRTLMRLGTHRGATDAAR